MTTPEPSDPPERTITVCSACLCASCFQGELYCDNYKTADTVEITIADLYCMGLEDPSYWREMDGEGRFIDA